MSEPGGGRTSRGMQRAAVTVHRVYGCGSFAEHRLGGWGAPGHRVVAQSHRLVLAVWGSPARVPARLCPFAASAASSTAPPAN